MKASNFDPVSLDVFRRQLKIAALFILVIFGVLILRLWFLQIVSGSVYRAKSENNRIRLQSMAPFRGVIRDRNGKILVDNRPSYDLYIIPEDVHDPESLLNRLADLGNFDKTAMRERLRNAAGGYPFNPVCLKKDISREELAMLETRRFDLPGVMIKVRPSTALFFRCSGRACAGLPWRDQRKAIEERPVSQYQIRRFDRQDRHRAEMAEVSQWRTRRGTGGGRCLGAKDQSDFSKAPPFPGQTSV